MTRLKKNASFPPPTGRYKVHVSDGDWRPYKAARLQISMNNPKHTGDKFAAEAEWVASRFEQVQLVVSDTLYRYNIMASHGVDEPMAYALALQIGDRWLSENAAAISMLPSKEITRWDDWLRYPGFADSHAQIIECYTKDKEFARQIDDTASAFVVKNGTVSAEKSQRYVELSRTYLLEEIAAFAVMHDAVTMIDVRPGSPLKPLLDSLKTNPVKGAPAGCQKIESVIIDFTRNKGFIGG